MGLVEGALVAAFYLIAICGTHLGTFQNPLNKDACVERLCIAHRSATKQNTLPTLEFLKRGPARRSQAVSFHTAKGSSTIGHKAKEREEQEKLSKAS